MSLALSVTNQEEQTIQAGLGETKDDSSLKGGVFNSAKDSMLQLLENILKHPSAINRLLAAHVGWDLEKYTALDVAEEHIHQRL